MEIKIDSTKDDRYFDREIINFTVKLKAGEPAKIEDTKKNLEQEGKNGFLVIYTIKNIYGKNEARGIAHVYKSEEMARKILPKYILEKNGVKNGKEETEKK
jgi:ribosomal protein S24E